MTHYGNCTIPVWYHFDDHVIQRIIINEFSRLRIKRNSNTKNIVQTINIYITLKA